MIETLLNAAFGPFTISLGLLLGLLVLELAFMMLGLSLMGDGPELDLDAADLPELGDLPSMGVPVDLPELADYDIPDVSDGAEVPASSGGLVEWMGMGRVPFIIWLAALLLGFGLTGVTVQMLALNILGFALPVTLVAAGSALTGLWFTSRFSSVFADILPKTESSSLSTRRYGGHKGVVTQGTARRGHPAEVRIIDRFGNFHYLRAEPVGDADEIQAGGEVIILRNRRTGDMRLMPLS